MKGKNIRTLFFDSSPVIYFVEGNPTYFPIVKPIFDLLDTEEIIAVTSAITLAECIYHPLLKGNLRLAREFENFITNEAVFVKTDKGIINKAIDIRVTYNLKLLDSIQLATAILTQCDAFLTNDVALKRVQEIQVLLVDALKEK